MVLNALLVEDSVDIRDTLVEAMEEMAPVKFSGIAVTEAGANEWLANNPHSWDIAIIDVALAEGSGFGVLENGRTRSTMQKMVVLTSHADKYIHRRCLELGADAVFDKTSDIEKLVHFCTVHASYLAFMRQTGLVGVLGILGILGEAEAEAEIEAKLSGPSDR